MTDKGKRAIIWCAVSSEEQAKGDKTSLPAQERDARQFAADNGLDIVDVLIVGGFSRRFYNYPEFVQAAAEDDFYDPERMLEHWRRRDFDVLIARDGSRLGREQGIFGEFVARTIHGGARMYLQSGGWIGEDNYREYITMAGYSAAKEVDRLRKGQKETKDKSASRGLTTGNKPPYSHKWVRNDAGKLVRLELDERKRRLWDDLATVFLEGISYAHIERVLYERYGHIDERTGKPFVQQFFYHLLHNLYFWGHAGRSYNTSMSRNGQKVGAWIYDPACPPPEGVKVYYNVNQPVYTGDQAERVKAELRRRALAVQGTARPYRTHKFTGLLLCAYCGHYLVFARPGSYCCRSISAVRASRRCERMRFISEKKVRAWLHARLTEMVEHDLPDLLARGEERPDVQGRIRKLTQEIAEATETGRALVMEQAGAHPAIKPIIAEQLNTVGERIEILQRALAEAEREARARDTRNVVAAFHELPENLDDLWTWEDTAINQFLHRLMGQRRLVMKDGAIVETDDAPPHPNRKERQRTWFGKGHKSVAD